MDDNFDKGTVGNYLGRLGLLILVSVYTMEEEIAHVYTYQVNSVLCIKKLQINNFRLQKRVTQ